MPSHPDRVRRQYQEPEQEHVDGYVRLFKAIMLDVLEEAKRTPPPVYENSPTKVGSTVRVYLPWQLNDDVKAE